MKLLFVSNGYPPHRWAGTETYTAGLAREFRRRGASVQVLCAGRWESGPGHDNGHDDDEHDAVAVRRLHLNWTKAPDPFRYLHDNPAAGRALDQLIAHFDPDVVHVTSCETLSASVLHVARRRGLPLVLSITDFWFLCPRMTLLSADGENCTGQTTPWDCTRCLAGHSRVYRGMRALLPEKGVRAVLGAVAKAPCLTRRRGLRGMVGDMGSRKRFLLQALTLPDVRITASAFVRDMHRANGVTVPIEVRPYGHDLSWLQPPVANRPSEVLRLGYVGQMVPSKGVDVLLEAVRRLQASHGGRIAVRLYGDTSKAADYGAQLQAMAATLPEVRFMGTYALADSAAVYRSFDVLVVPSLWYDFPLVIHQALAAGVPVVATNLGGMAEAVVPGRNGLLFDRGDAASLEARLRDLLDEPAHLDRLRSGIEPVKTTAEECDELQATYEALMAGPSARGDRA